MRDLLIKNFRCYEDKVIEFRRGINLLIGDNSVGKTSLLRACNLVNNSFFSGYSDEYTVWKSAEEDDFRVISSEITLMGNEMPINITFHLSEKDLLALSLKDGSDYTPEWKSEDLIIEKKSKKNSRNLITGLKPLKFYSSLLQQNSIIVEQGVVRQLNALPVYAYFTTEDIHTIRKFDKEKKAFKKYPQKPSFGYFESFDSKGLLDCWITRLLVLREAKKGEEEIQNVRNAIHQVLGENGCGIINDIEVRPNDGEVIFLFSDGREVKTDLLSDGYRRLVGIVIDIAIRCALLNKTIYGNEAYKKTHGTVIIDEIDEHLHPDLQVRVLKAFSDTFENIQFIVSTHSPLVISSVENKPDNVVYKLNYNKENGMYSHSEVKTYGMDASTIISVFMGESTRAIEIESQISRIRELADREDFEEALKMLQNLKKMTGTDDPEFTQLETMINFLEEQG